MENKSKQFPNMTTKVLQENGPDTGAVVQKSYKSVLKIGYVKNNKPFWKQVLWTAEVKHAGEIFVQRRNPENAENIMQTYFEKRSTDKIANNRFVWL